MVAQYSKTTPHRVPFWFKPVSTFGLLKLTTFNGSSHTLVVSTHPLLLSAFVLADSALPRGLAYRISGGYVVPKASHRAVTGSACLGRERLMEQPVSSGHTFSCETETQATCRSHKHVLRQVDTNCRNRHDGRSYFVQVVEDNACTLAHQCRQGGGVHPIVFVKAAARLNNRAENSHQPTRERERRMRGFRDPKRTQTFLSCFGPIQQHFALKRHLRRASLYRKQLAARFVAWREFTELAQDPSYAF
jgi:hypothetical protein